MLRRPRSSAILFALACPACSAFGANEESGGGGGVVAVVKEGVAAMGLAASGDKVAWTQADGVYLRIGDRAPYFGTGPLGGGNGLVGPVAVQGDQAIFLTSGNVARCDINGAPCVARAATGSIPGPQAFALTSTDVLVSGTLGGQVILYRCTLATCAKSLLQVAVLGGAALRMGATPVSVIIAVAASKQNTVIAKYTGTSPSTIVGDILALTGMANDATSVYWTDGGRGTLSACDLNDCAGGPRVLASNRVLPGEVVVDGEWLYWIEGFEQPDGKIMRCTLPACADGAPLASIAKPRLLAVADRVYVATDAALLSVTK